METVMAILMLLIGICAMLSWRLESENARFWLTAVMIIALLFLSIFSPMGRPLNGNGLVTNQVYENLTAIGDQNEILALIKDMDGNVRFYWLKQVPPKYFKVVRGANDEKVFQSFPPETPTD